MPLAEQIRGSDDDVKSWQLKLRDIDEPMVVDIEFLQLRLDEPNMSYAPGAVFFQFLFHVEHTVVGGCDLNGEKGRRAGEFLFRVALEEREIGNPEQNPQRVSLGLRCSRSLPRSTARTSVAESCREKD